MAIPKETNKELVVIVENELIDVAISPPVLDSVFVVGAPPPIDNRTVLFDGYEDQTLRLKTSGGLQFSVGEAQQTSLVHVGQMIFGYGTPFVGAGQTEVTDRIYFALDTLSFYRFIDGDERPDSYDIVVGTSTTNGFSGGILFDITDGNFSIRRWVE